MPRILCTFPDPYPELSVVKVNSLSASNRSYTGSEGVARAPINGDLGTIVHVHDVSATEPAYIVEAVDSEGYTLWIADFAHSELVLERVFNNPSGQ